MPVKTFKDVEGRIKRQAARFQVYVYDDESRRAGRCSSATRSKAAATTARWSTSSGASTLANKKAAWYEFHGLQGEHGYAPRHPLRNADITDPKPRQRLIIDPGPRSVDTTDRRRAHFDRDGSRCYAPTFPPPACSRTRSTRWARC